MIILAYQITPIKDGEQRDWTVSVNGETMDARHVQLTNPKLGLSITYGKRPEGYDGPILNERGGGGSVTIPYMIHPSTGSIYVGLILEQRLTLGEPSTYAVPRGMLDQGESHLDAAVRETEEEIGLKYTGQPILLAEGKNCNSTFFDTSEEGAGVKFFALPVSHTDLVEEDGEFVFPAHVTDERKLDKNEKIFGSRFLPIQSVLQSRDMISAAAAGYLLLFLMGNLSHS